jgi:hypothetical protein
MANWLDKYEQGGLVLKKKTKDNYGKRENANEGRSTAGPGWVGEGTTNRGFNYNGAWGGTMKMGGSMPGAVGFTYARVAGSAPANGKYTKKTKASAQNGTEMKFYQEGLDFKPKTISKNGSVIKDDRGQWAYPGEITEIGSNDITMQGVDYPVLGVSDTGDTQMMQPNQDYKFDGEKVTEYPMAQDGRNLSKELQKEAEERLEMMKKPKATMSQYTPKPGEQAKFDKQKLQRIAEDNAPLNRMAASKGAANMQDAIEAALIMEGGMAAGKLIGKGTKAAGKYLTEETALKNAYKLNPLAFKANPEAYYRMLGKEGYEDVLESGVIRANPGKGGLKSQEFNDVYFSMKHPWDGRNYGYVTKSGEPIGGVGYKGPYMAELTGQELNYPISSFPTANMAQSKVPISIENSGIKLYKQDWLKGYKEVPKKEKGGWLNKYK